MIVVTRSGTPNHMNDKSHTSGANAKKWLFNKLSAQDEWAATFNIAMRSELLRIRMEIADININELPVRSLRQWSVRDERTGVAICYELEKEQS